LEATTQQQPGSLSAESRRCPSDENYSTLRHAGWNGTYGLNHLGERPEKEILRSEERRVGKECRYGWWRGQYKKKMKEYEKIRGGGCSERQWITDARER